MTRFQWEGFRYKTFEGVFECRVEILFKGSEALIKIEGNREPKQEDLPHLLAFIEQDIFKNFNFPRPTVWLYQWEGKAYQILPTWKALEPGEGESLVVRFL